MWEPLLPGPVRGLRKMGLSVTRDMVPSPYLGLFFNFFSYLWQKCVTMSCRRPPPDTGPQSRNINPLVQGFLDVPF